MTYLEALKMVHATTRPRGYVEIGCRKGFSLGLANCSSVAIDPDYELVAPLKAPCRLFRETSDAFFNNRNLREILGSPVDLSFIDGMHLSEFALRDFINLERQSHPGSMVVVDDILPSTREMASRERLGNAWTGDVYKLIPLLRELRPDLQIDVFDIAMKGIAFITRLNPYSTSLGARLPELEQLLAGPRREIPSIEDLRTTLKPRPVGEIAGFLGAFTSSAAFLASRLSNEFYTAASSSRERYLQLLKQNLIGETYLDNELRIFYLLDCLGAKTDPDPEKLHDARNRLPDEYAALHKARQEGYLYKRKIKNAGYSHSMAGRKRLDQLQLVLQQIHDENIPGDVIECGVWRGGCSIFMKGCIEALGMTKRVSWVADSFAGLPPPTLPQDGGLDLSAALYPELAISEQVVKQNFASYHLLDDRVRFLVGWFKDTLGPAPIEKLSLLRLDGDLYESTMDSLNALYAKVSPGGFIVVDDYHAIKACRDAMTDYFKNNNLAEPEWIRVDWTCVYGRKP